MKAQGIKVVVQDMQKLERAVPPVAIVTVNVTFQLTGDLSLFDEQEMDREARKAKLQEMFWRAMGELRLD